MEWISVKERLPELYQDVLAYGDGTQDTSKRFYVARLTDKNSCWGWCIPGIGGLTITHWAPLPEPPK